MEPYAVYELEPGELVRAGPRSKHRPPQVFVAYRFSSARSKAFRDRLSGELGRLQGLGDIVLVDGKVLPSVSWSTEIRRRITQSKFVIADLTGLSPEVLFECGFAWGLGQVILPVVSSPDWIRRLPRWLTSIQVGQFETAEGWREIIDSIADILSEGPASAVKRTTPDPVPGRVLLLKPREGEGRLEEEIDYLSSRFELSQPEGEILGETIEDAGEDLIEEVCRASLLVGGLSGTGEDSFVHFATGVVASRPTAGVARRKLFRRVLLVAESTQRARELSADSARRATNTVRLSSTSGVREEVGRFGENYRRWVRDNRSRPGGFSD